ncbi:hypothetical protein PC116_g18928 [Phytophthora cactorum]|nr:hypothetical protein Pcac1_g27018 [Phytophthora cactorum]KAG4232864.1 hypothetical protein PC116_g18928 [Phytophthora cactorum]
MDNNNLVAHHSDIPMFSSMADSASCPRQKRFCFLAEVGS